MTTKETIKYGSQTKDKKCLELMLQDHAQRKNILEIYLTATGVICITYIIAVDYVEYARSEVIWLRTVGNPQIRGFQEVASNGVVSKLVW